MNTSYATKFASADAVAAWDRWIRLRSNCRVRDVTIDDTWQRAAQEVARSSPLNGDYWATRYVDAFAGWKLLPNACLLQNAGTPAQSECTATGCVVNLGAHVVHKPTGASVDLDALRDSAALAVRLADDIAAAVRSRPPCAGIGVIGVGTAIHALGLDYATPRARRSMQDCFVALSESAWATSAALARERGPLFAMDRGVRTLLSRRAPAASTLDAIERFGLRFPRLTRISSQPLLACMAGVTDALESPRGTRQALAAQVKLRARLQPWVDDPIETPLLAPCASLEECDRVSRLARRLRIPAPFPAPPSAGVSP